MDAEDEYRWARDFVNSRREATTAEFRDATVALTAPQRGSLLRYSHYGGLAGFFSGTDADNRGLLDLLTPDREAWITLAGSDELSYILKTLGDDLRREVVDTLVAEPVLLATLADNPSLNDIIKATTIDGQTIVEATLKDPVAVRLLAANSCLFMVVEWIPFPHRLVAAMQNDPQALEGLCHNFGVGLVGSALAPDKREALFDAIVACPEASRALATSSDLPDELVRLWEMDGPAQLRRLLEHDGALVALAGSAFAPTLARFEKNEALDYFAAAMASPEGRAQLAGNSSLPAVIDAVKAVGGPDQFMAALVADAAAQTRLAANREIAEILERVSDMAMRRALAEELLRRDDLLDCARYAIDRASSAERPTPPGIAIAQARWWGTFVRAARPDATREADAFEAGLAEIIADELYKPRNRRTEDGDMQIAHQAVLHRDYEICEELAQAATAAGLVFENSWPFMDPRPDNSFTAINEAMVDLIENDPAHPLANVAADLGKRRVLPPLFPEKTSSRAEWSGGAMGTGRTWTWVVQVDSSGAVTSETGEPPAPPVAPSRYLG